MALMSHQLPGGHHARGTLEALLANTVGPHTRPSEVPSRTSSNCVLASARTFQARLAKASFSAGDAIKGACAAGNAPKSRAGCSDKPRTRLSRQQRAPASQKPQGPSAGSQAKTHRRPQALVPRTGISERCTPVIVVLRARRSGPAWVSCPTPSYG